MRGCSVPISSTEPFHEERKMNILLLERVTFTSIRSVHSHTSNTNTQLRSSHTLLCFLLLSTICLVIKKIYKIF